MLPLTSLLDDIFSLDGYISILQERLDSDTDAIATMREAHSAYAAERFALLSEDHLKLVHDMDWVEALKDRGN